MRLLDNARSFAKRHRRPLVIGGVALGSVWLAKRAMAGGGGEPPSPVPGPEPGPMPGPPSDPKICQLDGQPYDSAVFPDDGRAILAALRTVGIVVPESADLAPGAWLVSSEGKKRVQAFQLMARVRGWGPYGQLSLFKAGQWVDGRMGACTLRSLAVAIGKG